MKLTDEQKKLIEDNLPFCYFYFQQYHIYGEDKQQSLLEKLCRSIHLYDSSRGTITTFITRVFQTGNYAMSRDTNRDIRKANNNAKLLSTPIYTTAEGDSLTIEDTLIALEDGIEKAENKLLIDNVFKNLLLDQTISKRDVELFLTYLDTLNYKFAGKLFGISGERVRQIVNSITEKITAHGLMNNTIDKQYLHQPEKIPIYKIKKTQVKEKQNKIKSTIDIEPIIVGTKKESNEIATEWLLEGVIRGSAKPVLYG